jgi:hypothetical protein
VAARESARAQPERVTNRAFAVEAKQPSSKHPAQSPSANQQQPFLRANAASHCVQCIGCNGARVATRENRLQLLRGGLKRVQERGARYKVADELRIPAPPLHDRARVHLCSQEGPCNCGWRRGAFHRRRRRLFAQVSRADDDDETRETRFTRMRNKGVKSATLLQPDFGTASAMSPRII